MFKDLHLKNYNPTICEITMLASSESVNSKLLNCDSSSPPSGPMIGPQERSKVQDINMWGMFKNLLIKNCNATILRFLCKHPQIV